MRNIGALLSDAWSLASPYYRSEERWFARLMLAAIIGLSLLTGGLSVDLNYWNGAFYDSRQNKDLKSFISLMLWYRWGDIGLMLAFVQMVMAYVAIAILRSYLEQF